MAADTVFLVTNGRKKPSKHLKLGLAFKSMTRSKKLIGMLNRYGHCVSYTTTEELETELTFTITSTSKILPPDLVPDSSLTVGIAYDNFDRTGLWKPSLAKTPCTTQWVLCTNLCQKKHPEPQLPH